MSRQAEEEEEEEEEESARPSEEVEESDLRHASPEERRIIEDCEAITAKAISAFEASAGHDATEDTEAPWVATPQAATTDFEAAVREAGRRLRDEVLALPDTEAHRLADADQATLSPRDRRRRDALLALPTGEDDRTTLGDVLAGIERRALRTDPVDSEELPASLRTKVRNAATWNS